VEFGSNNGTRTKEIAIDPNACPRDHEPEFKLKYGCWGWPNNNFEVLNLLLVCACAGLSGRLIGPIVSPNNVLPHIGDASVVGFSVIIHLIYGEKCLYI
jgi:hypothetical protein